ncbi:hypothetical protein [Paenarthrobacter sp. AMU7]|uniref:Uncharacterized protein n=1 Tax=Paenarthrobacter sp. AMU7 TaxID=3162492 RepID=A0AB39YRP7_9MICC
MNPLNFPEFPFSSPLAKAIIDLERVRADLGEGTTAPEVFTQLRTSSKKQRLSSTPPSAGGRY